MAKKPNTALYFRFPADEVSIEDLKSVINRLWVLSAKGHEKGFFALWELTEACIHGLDYVALMNPELVNRWARLRETWPTMDGLKPVIRKANVKKLKKIHLGEKPNTFNSALFKRWTPAKQTALFVIWFMHQVRQQMLHCPEWHDRITRLPTFQKHTWKRWSLLARELIDAANDNFPEKNPKLRRLGMYKANKHADYGPGTGTSESNIRSGIYDRLQTSIRSLAHNVAVVKTLVSPASSDQYDPYRAILHPLFKDYAREILPTIVS